MNPTQHTNTDIGPQANGGRPSMSDAERGFARSQESGVGSVKSHHTRSGSSLSNVSSLTAAPHHPHHHAHDIYQAALEHEQEIWNKLSGKGMRKVGWMESGKNALLSSWTNILLLFIPFSWAAHFLEYTDHSWGHKTSFALSFVAIIPLGRLFEWGGEQMAMYLTKSMGDLLVVTLNNAIEAALAIILLAHCELRLLQSTIVGVVILHLLLVPGTAFLTGGARVWEQSLQPHQVELNHSLLTIGVLSLLLPTAFFAALDRGAAAMTSTGKPNFIGSTLVTDKTRADILHISRGFAFILCIVYIASLIYMATLPAVEAVIAPPPPGVAPVIESKEHVEEEEEEEPLMNPWACFILLFVTVGLTATTVEWLVKSVEYVRKEGNIQEEWFGLIVLPLLSFSADGVVAVVYWTRRTINHLLGRKFMETSLLARSRSIDLSVQFTLWWMPFIVLLGWMINRPMMLLFDFFELALLLGSCFLVNYVTADAKTNWVEGLILVSFYIMIAVSAWFYVGQPELQVMLACPGTVAQAVVDNAAGKVHGKAY